MSQPKLRKILYSGFHSPVRGRIDVITDALMEIGSDGKILSILNKDDDSYRKSLESAKRNGSLEVIGNGTFLIPGLVDLHVHAPQYPQLGLALDRPLEVWLNEYTFPLEARYADAEFARRSYEILVDDLAANGTTTAVLFATIHEEATRILVDICLEKGLRAIVGKVAMDNPEECPEYYRDGSADESVEGTINIIDYIRRHPENRDNLVLPAIVPRFIPSCSDESLGKLGRLAKKYQCHVQTHCSESDWEHNYVLDRHGMTDAESLDRFGLLGRRSVLAHSCFLGSDDMERVRNRGAAVAHCPLSNSYFSDAVFPLKSALEKGLKVGLGTDISGGPNASILTEMRTAITMSRVLESGSNPGLPPKQRGLGADARIDFRDAFYLATAGGGIALDLPIGVFAPGYDFDAVVVDTAAENGTIRLWEDLDNGEGILQKIIYTGSNPNISQTWVRGRKVHGG